MELARPCLSALLIFLLSSSVAQSCNNGSVRLTVVSIDIELSGRAYLEFYTLLVFNYAVYYYFSF